MHHGTDYLNEKIEHIESAPADNGVVEMIVCRPAVDERTVLESGQVLAGCGLVGDNYVERGNHRTPDGRAHPDAELTIMTSRVLDAIAGADRQRWPLAGDQLIVDYDLSVANAPAGTRLEVGTSVLEVTSKPHQGCKKFAERFGLEAARWVNSRDDLRLRGINAIVATDGIITRGDSIRKV